MEINNLQGMGWNMNTLLDLARGNEDIHWTDPQIDYFLRVRYIGDYMPALRTTVLDFSYAFAYTKDGKLHSVNGLPCQITTKGFSSVIKAVHAAIINQAKSDHVYAKGLKVLDSDVLSVLT